MLQLIPQESTVAEALAAASNDVEAALKAAAKAEDDVQASIRAKERCAGYPEGILPRREANTRITTRYSQFEKAKAAKAEAMKRKLKARVYAMRRFQT